jgi:hypothetical protein
MTVTRIECRKNEEQDWKRKGKTKTTNRRRGEIPNPGGAFIPPTPPAREEKE